MGIRPNGLSRAFCPRRSSPSQSVMLPQPRPQTKALGPPWGPSPRSPHPCRQPALMAPPGNPGADPIAIRAATPGAELQCGLSPSPTLQSPHAGTLQGQERAGPQDRRETQFPATYQIRPANPPLQTVEMQEIKQTRLAVPIKKRGDPQEPNTKEADVEVTMGSHRSCSWKLQGLG